MSEFEINFVESQENKPLAWFRYIDDISFIWTHREDKLKSLQFLDLKVKLSQR